MPPKKVRGTLMTRAQGQDTTRNVKARLSHNGKFSPKVPSPTIPVAARNGGITARAMAAKTPMFEVWFLKYILHLPVAVWTLRTPDALKKGKRHYDMQIFEKKNTYY